MKSLISILAIALLLSASCVNSSRDGKNTKNGKEDSPVEVNESGSQNNDALLSKCSLDIILQIENDIDALTLQKMRAFLTNFSKDCRNNVEFSEVSNEVLFIVIEKYPELFVTVMCDNNAEIECEEIYFQLSQPLHDLIPVDSIYNRINQITQDCPQLDSIKKYLQIATENI